MLPCSKGLSTAASDLPRRPQHPTAVRHPLRPRRSNNTENVFPVTGGVTCSRPAASAPGERMCAASFTRARAVAPVDARERAPIGCPPARGAAHNGDATVCPPPPRAGTSLAWLGKPRWPREPSLQIVRKSTLRGFASAVAVGVGQAVTGRDPPRIVGFAMIWADCASSVRPVSAPGPKRSVRRLVGLNSAPRRKEGGHRWLTWTILVGS